MKKIHYKKYDLIFTEGDPGNSAYMIDEGKVAIISGKDIQGKHKVLAVLHKDSIFGEMALIDENVRTATAYVLEDCQLTVITSKTLHYLMEKEPLSLSPLLQTLSQRLRQTTKLLKDKLKGQHVRRRDFDTTYKEEHDQHISNYQTFSNGETIFQEGQTSDCAYIINSGSVGVYREDSQGKRSLVQELGAHAMFGEMGLIDKYPRSATVVALEKTKCMVIERPRFDYLKKFNSHFMIKLIKSFTERLRTTIAKLNQIDSSSIKSPTSKTVAIDYFH
ncbi:MAG: cyclic nucleotide-binding domain-containing protein [Nitrospina sp.]|jgi:CRP-like cAMP-binding protein|nr:cyclic nucleotide-binding domain-containing protein [Nitrospina sp.]MBT5631867.1 cyclic nucleotide-binding domain-containing protein [Nitrospina sp.]